jgi:uncharacterized protein YbjT (DUF2867 family)
MRVLLFGASGMIGSGVLRESLADPGVERVISIVRKPGTVQDAKLLEIVHEDFLNFGPIESLVFNEIDAAFFCLGVASAGMKETDYTHITYGITLAAARALLKASPAATFVYVSGVGTDSSEQRGPMWARVRGRIENTLLHLPLKTFIFRLGLVQPTHGAVSRTASYRLFYALTGPLIPVLRAVLPRFVTSTEQVGRAMLQVARHGAPRKVLDSADVNRLAAAGSRTESGSAA